MLTILSIVCYASRVKPAKPIKKRRTRRTAEEARQLILDAAERRLALGGPASLRLQEVAADVGVAHPTILHHFGSREALVEAVLERALAGVRRDVVAVLTSETFEDADGAALLELVVRALSGRGSARLLAWLALEGRAHGDPARMLRGLAELMHVRRVALNGGAAPFEETLFVVVLASLAMLGEGILGPTTWESAGLAGDARAPERFHAWLVRLLTEHLHPRGAPPGARRRPARAR